ncbi:hypothetical protein PC111_g17437 [Phytophthora cactorum]|nr:hypothetical protein PC111_g17437 [Phytophthora cactorum]
MGRGRRPRVNQNGGRRPNQFKNFTPTYEHRLQIVRFYANNSMKETLACYFPDAQGTTKETKRKSIHLWAKNKAKTERLGSTNATRAMRKLREVGTATVLSKETELQLVTWINEYRADGATVSGLMLHLKAREFAEASGRRGRGAWASSNDTDSVSEHGHAKGRILLLTVLKLSRS